MNKDLDAEVEEAKNDLAVSWLLRLRQLQEEDGMGFDEALKKANAEFPEG